MKFYKLIEKGGERRGVYSESDFKYMLLKGWTEVRLERNKPEPLGELVIPVFKRKPGRPPKDKRGYSSRNY